MNNTQGQNKTLILIVDDDISMRMLMRASLEQAGYETAEAENGKMGLEQFVNLRPDAVLLDVMMPGLDGYETCAALRKLPGGEHVPVLMATGLEDVQSIHRAFEVGATDFITKPINWVMLVYRVRYMLRASEAFHGMHKSQAQLSEAQRLAKIGNWEFDLAGKSIECSDECRRLLGLIDCDIENSFDVYLKAIHPEDKDEVRLALRAAFKEKRPYKVESRIFLSGEERIVLHQGDVVFDEVRGHNVVRGIIQDVTELKQAEEQIRYLAYYDGLTGLANRSLFKDRLKKAFASAHRKERSMALMFLDLDRFKNINDTLGHHIGDMLLKNVADRLNQIIRESDSLARLGSAVSHNCVSRLGGDEFTVLLSEIAHPEDVVVVAERMLAIIAEPLNLAEHEIQVTASIGISVFPCDGKDPDTLMKNADTAMYFAKEKGRNNFQFYEQELNEIINEKLIIESDLRKALAEDQFQLHYQPLINSLSGEIIGAEALIRWQHPERGLIPPNEFIPVAEESGLISSLTDWVLKTACNQNKAWQREGLKPIRIAVNLSGYRFSQQNIVELVERNLQDSQLESKYIELEITEGTLMQDKENSKGLLQQLKDMGLSIAIDDFGTGYSSLAYLKRFPIDTLKVDQSFVRDISNDPNHEAIVKAIVTMAQSLELNVTGEGVETKEELAILQKLGCTSVQGYYYSRPVPADDFVSLLKKGLSQT